MIIYINDLNGRKVNAYRSKSVNDTVVVEHMYSDDHIFMTDYISEAAYEMVYKVPLSQLPFE